MPPAFAVSFLLTKEFLLFKQSRLFGKRPLIFYCLLLRGIVDPRFSTPSWTMFVLFGRGSQLCDENTVVKLPVDVNNVSKLPDSQGFDDYYYFFGVGGRFEAVFGTSPDGHTLTREWLFLGWSVTKLKPELLREFVPTAHRGVLRVSLEILHRDPNAVFQVACGYQGQLGSDALSIQSFEILTGDLVLFAPAVRS